jgi:putative ABC transport system permease protein
MGHNLVIIPAEADPLDTYLCADDQVLFDEAVTARMAERLDVPSRYYASVLQRRIQVGERTLLLTGMMPVHRPDETLEKAHLVTEIPSGHARLGCEAARVLRVSAGEGTRILSRAFRVAEVLPSLGTLDDYRVYVPLAECQALLGKPGQINLVLAFLCLHGGTLPKVMRLQREVVGELFPELRIITRMSIARGRDLARRTTSQYLQYLLVLVSCTTVVVIAVTGLQEVSERRREVGILLAMGANYTYIVGLYVVKLLVLALLAAAAGFFVGSHLSRWLLTPVLVAHTRPIAMLWGQLPSCVGLTCVVALLAATVPMAKLVRMDPNAILMEE